MNSESIDLKRIKTILVVKLDRIGDFVLATSFLRELRRNAPQAHIDLLVSKESYGLAALCPYVNSVLVAELSDENINFSSENEESILACHSRFQNKQYDLAIVPRWDYDYFKAGIVACATRAPHVVGFKAPAAYGPKPHIAALYSDLIDRPFAAHEVEHNLSVIRYLGGAVESDHLELWTTREDDKAAEHRIREFIGGPVIAVCPGASLPRKTLDSQKLARILKRVQASAPHWSFIVLGGPGDEAAGKLLERELTRCKSFCGQTTLRETAAIIKRAQLLIGMDSGPGHIAAAVNVPTIIFSCFAKNGNPIENCSPLRWKPFGSAGTVVLQPDYPVFPCKDVCTVDDGSHCIDRINDDWAVETISRSLSPGTIERGFTAQIEHLSQRTAQPPTPARNSELPAKAEVKPIKYSGRYCKLGEFALEIPGDHMLPVLLEQHPLYDRFLPFLGRGAETGEWIIDVGANVGDTLTAMLPQTKASVLAVEGHDTYFGYLTRNVSRMSSAWQTRVRCLHTLAGTMSGTLQAANGTAKLVKANHDAETIRTLDQIASENGIDADNVYLIKTDTDGFDADVLASAGHILRSASPLVYFENQVDNHEQASQFEKLYEMLSACGYGHWWVFDNFGNLLLENTNALPLPAVNRYLLTQQERRSTRTFYYIDILASKADRYNAARDAVASYKRWVRPGALTAEPEPVASV